MVLPLIMAGIGAATFGFGLFESLTGRDEMEEGLEQQRLGLHYQRMGAEQQYRLERERSQTSREFAGRERDLHVASAERSTQVAAQSAAINTGIINTQVDMERQRLQAMEIDARRSQTEIIRNQQRARALAVTTATAQGASRGSGLQGGYGQISGQTTYNALGVQQQLDLGRNMFNLNSQLAGQRTQMVDLESQYAAFRASQQTAGANMMYDYAVRNADFQDRASDIQTNYMSYGQSLINEGQGTVASGQSQANFGSSLMSLGMNVAGMGPTIGNIFGNLGGVGATATGFSGGMGLGYGMNSMSTGRFY